MQTINRSAPYLGTTVLVYLATVELGIIMLIFFFFENKRQIPTVPILSQELKGYQLACALLSVMGEDPAGDGDGMASFRGAVVSERCQTRSLQSRNADPVLLNRFFGVERNKRKMVSLLLTNAVFCCVGTELVRWSLESTCAVKLKKHF